MQSQPSNHKNCPSCGGNFISKNGHRTGVQRYKCKECKTQYQATRRPVFQAKKLMSDYLFKNSLYLS